jgi:hypothetical protein
MIRRAVTGSTSFVLALRAAGADSTNLPVGVSPREGFGRLSFEDLMETASLGTALEA